MGGLKVEDELDGEIAEEEGLGSQGRERLVGGDGRSAKRIQQIEGQSWGHKRQSIMEELVEESNDSLERSKEDLKPKFFREFNSEIAAYDFYNEYARSEGFSIRREAYAADKQGVLSSRIFVCCKEGLRKADKRDDLTRNPRGETRTNCGAIMGINLVRRTGKYSIYRFSEEHNHPLINQESIHFMPSHRKITSSDEAFLDLTANSGHSSNSAFELMGQQAGGRESLGFIMVDQKNYLGTIRQKKMKFGEAGYLIEYFSK
ncbi:uncharacterized protein A4U43_C01F19890 [Asparagus officinalis]|uniref:FAR1 domain-containing protein n=1 Tax=Asparagus officinalis TaxID=4686 RepID=A0A5P1FRB8_ASPOF|nr:uncharacterized protein A4U43_C01F19890 [Asparagus officinalis]